MKIALLLLSIVLSIDSLPALIFTQPSRQTTYTQTYYFSQPQLNENHEFSTIFLPEANAYLTQENQPMLPIVVIRYEFPRGTKIYAVDVAPSESTTQSVPKKIQPTPVKQKIQSTLRCIQEKEDITTYTSTHLYPSTWYTYSLGSGLNNNNERVVFLSIQLYPVRYTPSDNSIHYIQTAKITITYTETQELPILQNSYDLLIIAPEEYVPNLQPLITHKNQYNITTKLYEFENICTEFTGRDDAEKIKYCIKYALDTWGTNYVLLVGDIKKIPMRHTYASWWEPDILSDLYYADIYDANDTFCSWDKNNNNRFGETNGGHDIDGVDLYADIHIGRLACATSKEVDIVVNKIIAYETSTYGTSWFKTIIVAGGDTFPPGCGAPPNVFEGEITNSNVLEQIPSFTPVKLWTSTNNLNAKKFNEAINQGAGFLSYAGHGFEHGWGTYRSNSLSYRMGFSQPLYYTPFIKKLNNHDKLPVMFFDACLTAKLDFNVSDLIRYYPGLTKLLILLSQLDNDPSIFYPCFAWSLVSYEHGGAIAAVGSTRTAYTHVDSSGVHAGAGYLDVHFFKAYEEGVYLGQMLTRSQNDYISYVGRDYFTLEEFILLGDPSLKIGGYE